MRRSPLLTLLLLAAALAALLAIGALQARQAYLTRGIPPGLPEPIPHGGAALGVNVALEQYNDAALSQALSEIANLGIDHIKQSFYFADGFDWEASDRLVTAVTTHNLTLVPLLDGNPANGFAPVAPAAFADWARQFATRYGDQIDAYIIWDEPNLTSHWGGLPVNANEYAALLTAAAQAIRSADSDAIIVAAPLAPTVETGPTNLADHLYLQQLYEAGAANAFDVVAGKPYGFNTGPDDRRVDLGVLNFSRAILLREVLARSGEGHKAVWAGNWGWNSLPPGWTGTPSVWGQVSAAEQARHTTEALQRARREWPWMGLMFLENWEPDAPLEDARWGFSIAGSQTDVALANDLQAIDPAVAYPGFHLAHPDDPAQVYRGDWRFSPEFGADISQTAPGEPPDEVTFTFWGTDVGLRVRRADFRARLYVTVDGQPANALPRDENGSALILTSPDPGEDFVTAVPVATGLPAGEHVVRVVASRGWDQWALNGFSAAYQPSQTAARAGMLGLGVTAVLLFITAVVHGRGADWGGWGRRAHAGYARLGDGAQLALTAAAGALVAVMGWLTWGEQIAGVYRRLGDVGQLALTAAAASIFYVAPSFLAYGAALLALLGLLLLRPAWGLALIAFSFPFYVPSVLKPVFSYRFSPVEIFTLVAFAAVMGRQIIQFSRRRVAGRTAPARQGWQRADWAVLVFTAVATLSLLFTERLGVATNEWRLVIVEPALFYLMLRLVRPRPREMWVILDAFVAGGVVVALIGLGQYATGQDLITAEAGLMRLRSIYGSPNNVALYLGRVIPLLAAVLLLGQAVNLRRRWAYAAALLPTGLALLLTFSKGGLFLGVPAGLLVVFWIWMRRNGRSPWPWAIAAGLLGATALVVVQRIPPLAARLDLTGTTGVFRLNLWRASLEMVREHPLFGVGLDNFLYAYRGRYIFDAAWQEPNLNHPHNIVLDFATRVGLLGLLAGAWMVWELARSLWHALRNLNPEWLPVAVGFSGSLAAILAHGLVDHSFFLVDLAFVFYLMLGTAVWLNLPQPEQPA